MPTEDDWAALGVPPTRDRDVVRNAYRARLKQVGPDRDPERFQALRAAYETVLASLDAETSSEPSLDSDLGEQFTARLAMHRAAGDEAGAAALVDAIIARHPPGSAALQAVEEALLETVALSTPLSSRLFLHLAERFDWRDMGGYAARSQPERHAAVLDRIAAEDWMAALQAHAAEPDARVERLLLMRHDEALRALSEQGLSNAERQRVRELFDGVLAHGGYTLPRFHGDTLALLREAVEGPPLLGDTAPAQLAGGTPPPKEPAKRLTGKERLAFLGGAAALLALGGVKLAVDHYRRPDVGERPAFAAPAASAAVAMAKLKDPSTPWLVTRREPDGVFVDWSPMVKWRNGLSEIRIGAETPQPTTAMPVPVGDYAMGFLAPPTLTYMTMRVRYKDGQWSEVRRYPIQAGAR